MDYSGNIASADEIKIVLESNRRMIDRVTETMRIAIAHTNSQSSVLIKTVSRELITKNLQPLLSHSTMQAIVKIQSEQIAKISKSLPNISKLYPNDLYNIDEEIQLDTEEVEVPYSVEAKVRHLNIWLELVNHHPKVASLIVLLFVHYVSDPMWSFADTHYMFPIFQSYLNGLRNSLTFPR
ncbi:hypothetical protein [Weissella cibaria]|uniref:hypothetical protein n=1 Tax=Weissella cibaria TaxID=137591 RepID=UPI00223BC4C5|nr:hypothetical protein [Weissella cibaria]MCT0021117.1 hypothetical protein [Weissella cibaria]